jgi:hypothetical protein
MSTTDLFPQAAPAAYTCSTCGAALADEEAVLMHCCPSRLPLIAEAARITIRPGDTLALKVDGPVSKEQNRQLIDYLQGVLPAGTPVLVLDRQMSLLIINVATEEGV